MGLLIEISSSIESFGLEGRIDRRNSYTGIALDCKVKP